MRQITLPAELLNLLDGSLPASHLNQALRLASVDDNGWPYAAQLSLGELIAPSPEQLLFAIWPDSTTTRNLTHNGKMALELVLEGAVVEVQALAQRRVETLTELGLTVFSARVQQVITHRAPYATVTSGLTFRLKDQATTLTRWRQQVRGLQGLAS